MSLVGLIGLVAHTVSKSFQVENGELLISQPVSEELMMSTLRGRVTGGCVGAWYDLSQARQL